MVLVLSFPPSFILPSIHLNQILDFATTAAHISPSSLLSLLLSSSPPCFALSPPGWLLHQPRHKLILEFCPWFPPLSPWAVTCQRCPPLGSHSCCNYLWHPGSGASTQVTRWRGVGWVQRGWKEEREVLSVQPTGRCQKCCWSACYCRSQEKTIRPPLNPH